MALTAEQIKMLEGMEGIDQGLVSGYKSRNATPTLNAPTQTAADVVTTSEANPDLTGPQKAADTGGVDQQSEFTNFTVAVNKGIDMARQQRQDMVLDTVGGMAPAGALPASSFASVIDQFNRSAAPIQSEMIGAALEDRQNDKERKLTVENQIRELSMSVASETGDTKVAQMILAELNKPNPDLDAAINMSLIPLGSEYTRSNNSIVKTDPKGNEEVLFSWNGSDTTSDGSIPDYESWKLTDAGKSAIAMARIQVGPKGTIAPDLVESFIKQEYDRQKQLGPMADISDLSATKGNDLVKESLGQGLYQELDKTLTQPEIRRFYQWWAEENKRRRSPYDAEQALLKWIEHEEALSNEAKQTLGAAAPEDKKKESTKEETEEERINRLSGF